MEQKYDTELKDYIVGSIGFPDPSKAWNMICQLVKVLRPYHQDIKNNFLLDMTVKTSINNALREGRFDSTIVDLPKICDEHKRLQENIGDKLYLENVCIN